MFVAIKLRQERKRFPQPTDNKNTFLVQAQPSSERLLPIFIINETKRGERVSAVEKSCARSMCRKQREIGVRKKEKEIEREREESVCVLKSERDTENKGLKVL